MSKEALIEISPDGSSIKVDAGEGFVGTECHDFAKSLADSLGKIEEEEFKEAYYQTQEQPIKIGR